MVINPFGLANLIGRNVRVPNDPPTINPVGTDGFEYLIRANPSRNYDIQFRDDIGATMNIEIGGRVITRIRMTATEMHIGNNYSVNENGLTQRYVLDIPNYNEVRATFRLELLQSRMFRRLDIRYSNFSWVTILLYNNRVMSVALNGPNLIEGVQMACEEAMQRGVQAQQEQAAVSTQFGLLTHASVSRNASRPVTPIRTQAGIHEMPSLVPSSSLTAAQLAFVAARRLRHLSDVQHSGTERPNENVAEEEGAVGGVNRYSQSVADLIAEQIIRPFRWSDRDTQ